jgi:hypothetical protein
LGKKRALIAWMKASHTDAVFDPGEDRLAEAAGVSPMLFPVVEKPEPAIMNWPGVVLSGATPVGTGGVAAVLVIVMVPALLQSVERPATCTEYVPGTVSDDPLESERS